MVDWIRAHPGCAKADIADGLGLAWATVCYQVDILADHGAIAVERARGRVFLFTNDQTKGFRRKAVARTLEPCASILCLLQSVPQVSIPVVTKALGIGRRAALTALNILESAELIERRGKGQVRYGLPYVGASVPAAAVQVADLATPYVPTPDLPAAAKVDENSPVIDAFGPRGFQHDRLVAEASA